MIERANQIGDAVYGVPACPIEEVWMELALGNGGTETERHIEHAATCATCCRRLKDAVALSLEETSEQEEEVLRKLDSMHFDWTRRMSHMMVETCRRAAVVRRLR